MAAPEQSRPPRASAKPGAMTMAMQAVPNRTSGPKVLRIGLFRDKKIVEERIIRNRETVSIGTSAKNHLIIKSGTLPAKFESRFQLFQLVGDHYILNFTEDMTVDTREESAQKIHEGMSSIVASLEELSSSADQLEQRVKRPRTSVEELPPVKSFGKAGDA